MGFNGVFVLVTSSPPTPTLERKEWLCSGWTEGPDFRVFRGLCVQGRMFLTAMQTLWLGKEVLGFSSPHEWWTDNPDSKTAAQIFFFQIRKFRLKATDVPKSTKILIKKHVLTCLKEGGVHMQRRWTSWSKTRGLLCEQNKEGVCVSPYWITCRLCKTQMFKPSVVEDTGTTAVEPEIASGLWGQPMSYSETLANSK